MSKQVKSLVLVRGLPGSGKTTFAEQMAYGIGQPVLSADQYFEKDGEYKFDATQLGAAHAQCQKRTEEYMADGWGPIFVANTFTTEREIYPYKQLALKYGYMLFSVIVENRSQTQNVHGVPADTLKKMADRFHIQL